LNIITDSYSKELTFANNMITKSVMAIKRANTKKRKKGHVLIIIQEEAPWNATDY
jgi:hypothetical protein